MAEVAFEYLAAARETVRGTAIAAPTRYLNLRGKIEPKRNRYKAPPVVGSLAGASRSVITGRWGEWEGEGELDIISLPFLLAMCVKGGVTATTPGSAVLTRRFTYQRAILVDNVKTATLWDGDPNQAQWKAAFGTVDELTITSEPSGEDVAMVKAKGHTRWPSYGAAPAAPTALQGDLIVPGNMQVWMDTSLAIGTTQIMGRTLAVEHTIPSGITYKYPDVGPGVIPEYDHIGRESATPSTTLTMDMISQAQYDLYDAGTPVKLRVRHNGPLIENISGTLFYFYVQVDMWGPLEDIKWSDYEGNRTMELTLDSEPDATSGTDCTVEVQTNQTTE